MGQLRVWPNYSISAGLVSAHARTSLTDLQTLRGNFKFELFRHEQISKEVVRAGVVAEDAATRLRVVKGDEGSHALVLVFIFSAFSRHIVKFLLKLGSVMAMIDRHCVLAVHCSPNHLLLYAAVIQLLTSFNFSSLAFLHFSPLNFGFRIHFFALPSLVSSASCGQERRWHYNRGIVDE